MDDDDGQFIPFLDMYQNLLMAVYALFVLAFFMMNPKKVTEKNVEVKAEYLITVTWDKESDDDVDTYLQGPDGKILFFQAQEIGIMHLDRDDLGKLNDRYRAQNGETAYLEDNREIVTLRGIVSGEYILNVHMYQKKSDGPCKIVVTVDKINPYSTIKSKTIIMTESGDEHTICRFKIDAEGTVLEVNELEKSLIQHDRYYNDQDEGD